MNGTTTLSVTGGNTGAIPTYALAANDPCSISGDVLTANAVGSCTVTATLAGDDSYTSVTSDLITVNVALGPQEELIVSSSATALYVTGTATLSASGGSGSGLVSYAVAQNDPCSINGTVLTATGAGVCTITASKAADSTYDETSSAPITVSVALNPQAALVASAGTLQLNVNDTTTLSTTGGSGPGLVSYAVAAGDACSISGNVLTATATGLCTITASKAADSVYDTISAAPITVSVGLRLQDPLIASATATQLKVNETTTLSTTGGSGTGLVSYAVSPANVCSINGNVLTATAVGQCTITATKAADSVYNPISATPITVDVTLKPQPALMASASPTTLNVNGTSELSVTGGAGDGAVTYLVTQGDCSVAGNILTANGAGSCTVTATRAADNTYSAVTSEAIMVTVSRNAQTALKVAASPSTISINDSSTLSTTGGSGTGAVRYDLISGPCSLNDTILTGTAAGSCVITATKALDSRYDAETSSPVTVIVGLLPQSALSVTAAPTTFKTGETSQLATIGGSGTGAVSYAVVSGPCSLTGNTLGSSVAGKCLITATKAADSTHAEISSDPLTITVDLSPQSALVTVTSPTTIAVNGISTLSSTGGSGTGAVVYALVSGPCTLTQNQLTGTSAGSCSVTATKAGDDRYIDVTASPITVTVGLSPQSALSIAAAPTTINVNASSTLTTTGGSGTGAVSFTLVDGPCSVVGSTVTGIGAGSCTLTASKAADTQYAETTSSPITLTVGRAPQSPLTLLASPSSIKVDDTSTLDTTGGSGTGSTEYSLVSGPCSINGNELVGLGAGSCVVTARKAADSSYAMATSSPLTVTVGLAPQSALSGLANPSTLTVLGTTSLTVTGGSGSGAVTYTLENGPCAITGDTLTGLGEGSCTITATKAADSRYAEAQSPAFTVTVGLAPQSALSVLATPASLTVNGSSQLSSIGGSGTGDLSYQLTSGPCSLTGSSLTGLEAGSCVVTVTRGADSTYAIATSAPVSVSVGLAAQAPLTLSTSPEVSNNVMDVDDTTTLITEGGSGSGNTTYKLISGPCAIAGDKLIGLGEGSCAITATKAEDTGYAAITSDVLTVVVGLIPQTQLVLTANPALINLSNSSALSVSGGNGDGAVSYRLVNGPCTVSGNTLTGLAAGSCAVTATRAATSRYAEKTSAPVTVTVTADLMTQPTLSLSADPAAIVVNGTTVLASSGGAGSGLMSYSLISGPCTLVDNVLTGTGAGICTVTASKAAADGYAAADAGPITISVALGSQDALVASATATQLKVNETTTLSTTGGSGTGLVSYAVAQNDPCSINGSVLTATGAGQCTITASKAGDGVYDAISAMPITISVALGSQDALVAVTEPAGIHVNGTATIKVSGGSGSGSVTFAVSSGSCTLAGNTVTGSEDGYCTIMATRAADETYDAATTSLTIAVTGVPVDVMASAGDGQATVRWTPPTRSVDSPITAYHVTGEPSGECHVMGDSDYPECEITGLTNGGNYSFTVRAENATGQGAESLPSNIVTPFTLVAPAGAPTKPTVAPGDGQVSVSWPQNLSGGDPVEYQVMALPGGQTCTIPFPGRAFATAGCTVTGLVNGTSYEFIVTAMNSVGNAYSDLSDAVTPSETIDGECGSAISTATLVEPTAFLCAAGEASAVTAEQGRYSWLCSGAGGGSTAQCGVQGQENPVNEIGSATLTTPTSNGCAIQRAELQPLPLGARASGATLPFGVVDFEMAGCEATAATIKVTYSGVVEGMAYLKYRHGHWTELTADNANLQLVGNTATFVIEDNGPFDADPAVGIISDPGGPGYASLPPMPGVVEAPSATAGDAEATVSWTAPLSGGPAVRYTVTSTPDAKTCTVLAPETRCKVTGLTNDRAYTFNIVAENAAGKGSVSADTRAVTPRYAGTSGLCGTAQGQATLMPPVAGLCESGTASAVTTEKGVHRWICAPVGSALPSSCSAPGLSARGAIGTVSFELQPGSGCAIRKTALGSVPFGVPKKVSLPYGLVDFSLAQCTAEYADLRMTFSGSVEGLSLWKWIHQTWTRIPGVDVSGHTVRFRVKDNGPYDADPERGVIVDPAAVGTSSGKKDQPTLTVKSGKSRIKSGRAVLVKTRGGKGRGKVNYHVKASGGTSCRVLRNGALTLLKTSGTRDGTCTVWATKAADRKYNAAVSSPVTIGVICPKP